MRLITGFLLALFLCGPVQAQDAVAPLEEEIAAPEAAVAIEPVARDSQIERRIREILKATGWYEKPKVAADDGVVFLDGVAKTDEQRRWARDLAAKTQDVVAVVNRIEVSSEVSWSIRPALAEIERLGKRAIATLPLIVLSIIVLPLAWYAARAVSGLARRMLTGRVRSVFLRDVIARMIALPVLLIGVYLVLQVAGLTRLALSLMGGAGVLGIVIGFAFRDIAENFLASLLLSIRQPFSGGDFIDVAGMQGIVQSMNTRSTVLLSVEGNHIQIPNATVFKSTIVNYSAAPMRRGVIEIGVGYDASIAKAQTVVMDVLRGHDAVSHDTEPLVLVDALGASTVNLKGYYWFNGHEYSSIKVQSALLRLVKKALTEAGVSMPDEAREVIFPEGVPVIGLGEGGSASAPPPPRQPEVAQEDDDAATLAEGDLGSDTAEIEAQAADAQMPEGGRDLLSDEDDKPKEATV